MNQGEPWVNFKAATILKGSRCRIIEGRCHVVRHMPLETKSVGSQIALWPRKNLSSNLMCGVYSMVKVRDVQGEADTKPVSAH